MSRCIFKNSEIEITMNNGDLLRVIKYCDKKSWAIGEGLPNPGDHIRIFRVSELITYYHHGIYISENEVIHFTSFSEDASITNTSEFKIMNTPFKGKYGFLRNSEFNYEIRKYSMLEKIPKNKVSVIIEKAKSKIGESGYNFLTNNCEHFAYDCTHNMKISTQLLTKPIEILDNINFPIDIQTL